MFSRLGFMFGLLGLIGVCVLALFLWKKEQQVVYVDSVKLINEYQGMIDARKAYQGKILVWKSNIDTLAKEVQSEISRFEKQSGTWTAHEKELSKQVTQAKQQQLKEYQRAISEKAGQEDAVATKKVVDEINAYIRKYSELQGYTLVLAATEYGNVVYAKNYLDITDAVLAGLNADYGKASK